MASRNGKPKNHLSSLFDALRNDYEMTKQSRFNRKRTGLAPQGGSGDYHIRNDRDYYDAIEKARDMDRNDAMIGQVMDRACNNIVQDGFSLDFKTGDRKLDAELKARWLEETSNPDMLDIAEEMNFHDMEWLACRSMFLDGDCGLAALEKENKLQFIEAHQIRHDSPDEDNIVLGVKLNKHRRREAFFVSEDSIDPYDTTPTEPVQMRVRNSDGVRQFFHVYDPKRSTLTRGVTKLAPVFNIAGMLEDVNFAKLVQQQIVSCFAILRTQQMGAVTPSLGGEGYGSESTIETSSNQSRQLDNVSPGMEITGMPGETLEGFSPNVPNAEYFEQVRLLMQLIGANLGLPLVLVLMDGSETNFSGWRGAVDEARKGFKYHQRNLVKRLHDPFHCWKVYQWMQNDPAIARAAKKPKVNIYGHKFNPPQWPYIEPIRDAQGDITRLQGNLTSPRRLHSERSNDWEEIISETVDDNALAIEIAKRRADKLNKKHPTNPVHWRELVALPLPPGLTVGLSSEIEAVQDEAASEME